MINRLINLKVGLVLAVFLSGCVAVSEPEPEFVRVTGMMAFKEQTLLPAGSQATVAVIDADKRGVILSQTTFPVAKLPAPFYFSIPADKLDSNASYVVWATIKVKGQPLLQTFDRYPVINNGQNNTNVLMKVIR